MFKKYVIQINCKINLILISDWLINIFWDINAVNYKKVEHKYLTNCLKNNN